MAARLPGEPHSDTAVREEIRGWLADHLVGQWAGLIGTGGTGRDHERFDDRLAWNRLLADHGWTCPGWPVSHGGRGLSLSQQVIFHEEYARAQAPALVNHMGEQLLGPTLIAFGTPEQQRRFLPPIVAARELWAQGYSEPGAGSDLASVQTRARLDQGAGEWVIDGQKIWTSHAHRADWAFVLTRSEPGSHRHRGLSFLLVPLDQPGVEVRPIRQLTGDGGFAEVFFDSARTAADLVVGEPGDGWRVAMGLLGFERGVSMLGRVVAFAQNQAAVVALARSTGAIDDPVLRDRLAESAVELEAMRAFAMRTMSSLVGGDDAGSSGATGSIFKLLWSGWHRKLGELAMDVAGRDGLTLRPLTPGQAPDLDAWQRLFLFSHAGTIYGGSSEVQRTILAERVLGLPRDPPG